MISMPFRRQNPILRQVEINQKHATRSHERAMSVIASANEKGDNLKQVLKDNHISVQISKSIGNRNAHRNPHYRSAS